MRLPDAHGGRRSEVVLVPVGSIPIQASLSPSTSTCPTRGAGKSSEGTPPVRPGQAPPQFSYEQKELAARQSAFLSICKGFPERPAMAHIESEVITCAYEYCSGSISLSDGRCWVLWVVDGHWHEKPNWTIRMSGAGPARP